MQARRAISIGCCALSLGVGCEAVIGADFDAREHSCRHAAPPPPPAVRNAGGGPEDDVWAAITALEVGEGSLPDGSAAHRTIGFDLDDNCSNLGQRPTCRPFAWAEPHQTDGVDGIDNSAGALMRAQVSIFNVETFNSAKVTAKTRSGDDAPVAVFRVRGFNGRADDDVVELDWYVGQKFGTPPKLDGSDEWPLWDQTLAIGSSPAAGTPVPSSRFRDAAAYVTDYVLVAHLPAGTPLKLANTTFVTEGLTLALKFGPDLKRIASGVLGGHVRATELFRKMPQMVDAFVQKRLCTDDTEYPKVKRYFCSFIDALAGGRDDPDATCDAISLGIRFDTTAVTPGPLRPDEPFDPCPPAVDPANDTCATAP